MPEAAARIWAAAGFEVQGLFVWFPRCPATYVTAFTREMFKWFGWLDLWGKTPFDMGLRDEDEIDPRYEPAMTILKAEFQRLEREELDHIKKQAGEQ